MARVPATMNEVEEHFAKGVEMFNRGDFFEAHEEMEEAMNLLGDDTSDWDFYLGLLRAALKFLEPYSDRHRGIKRIQKRAHRGTRAARIVGSCDTAANRDGGLKL